MKKQQLLEHLLESKLFKRFYYFFNKNIIRVRNFDSKARLKNCLFNDNKNDTNKVVLDKAHLKNCKFIFSGGGNSLIIEKGAQIQDLECFFLDNNSSIVIGKNTQIGSNCKLVVGEETSISIGEKCLISYDVEIRSTDSHSLFNEDGIRINKAKNVLIGNHVWISSGVIILKGTIIDDECMIGTKSIITQKTPHQPKAMIVGAPGTIRRENIQWNEKRVMKE